MSEVINMTKENCRLCNNQFMPGERYDDMGATFEDGNKEPYFCHVECIKKEMEKYRSGKMQSYQNELESCRANAQLLRQKLQIAHKCLVQIKNWEEGFTQDGNDPPAVRAAKVLKKLDMIDGE
jgi:hypothetical protein